MTRTPLFQLPTTADGALPRLGFGADYNPEQWPREVWAEDVRLMRLAGVNLVSLAIFSWARIQPGPETWDFGWLDEVMDLLHAHGIAVDLATATASPPPWLTTAHPEILPVTASGETVWPGARQHWRPTSPVFREHALRLVAALAERYASHPALVAWHVSNELGCHNIYDYSDDAARAFRNWLRTRYGDLDTLNHAWGTAFWSQRYGDWEQILPPRLAASHPNPTQQLDFKRFSSDALKEHLRAERAILRAATPDVPVTTNFMVMGGTKGMNYADWAAEVDFVSNDHYVLPGPQSRDELSFSANLTGNLAGGRPWYLMEHSTSAVNWQPVNLAKRQGELARDSLLHVAHGADAVCFFQWRQSVAGAEKYHSAMVPHAGADSETFRAVAELGRVLGELAPLAGTRREPAQVAILFDWESWWASELDSHPTSLLDYRREALDWYSALLALGIRADVVTQHGDLERYRLLIAPVLHVVPAELATRLTRYAHQGGHLITTYFSGIVDQHDHIWLGGYPGALRDLLGIRIEEFGPLLEEDSVLLDDGLTGTLWTDRITVTDPATEILARYRSGEYTGRAALTRRAAGAGSAAYVSTRLGPDGLARVLPGLLDHADVRSELPEPARGRVELAVRTDGGQRYLFLVNRTDQAVPVPGLTGDPLIGGALLGADGLLLGPRDVAVLRAPSG
ncbi:beta-galactosidase [Kitasatospora gansuensis]|uniref:Beta-galactosidase n=1 Tax=Kitasatospora gansuensis TaxID=258050 RepID=A0A7W7S9W0_9ACTN|nr:beta-galactosidase [Kitasatospora gansuensis]MBB4945521.1 beta-galactosidase [Kitasatospora gansuensis]